MHVFCDDHREFSRILTQRRDCICGSIAFASDRAPMFPIGRFANGGRRPSRTVRRVSASTRKGQVGRRPFALSRSVFDAGIFCRAGSEGDV